MHELGTTLPQLPVELFKVRDLERYEGCLLSEYKTEEGTSFLFSWVDASDLHNRWMVFPVHGPSLEDYLRGILSLRTLVAQHPDRIYLLDTDGEGTRVRVAHLGWNEIPEDYLPSQDSFFDPALAPT